MIGCGLFVCEESIVMDATVLLKMEQRICTSQKGPKTVGETCNTSNRKRKEAKYSSNMRLTARVLKKHCQQPEHHSAKDDLRKKDGTLWPIKHRVALV